MATKGVYFNGKLIQLPGVYSSVESTMTATKSGQEAKIVALLGECRGGEPGTVQFFDEPSAAKRILKDGELLKAAQKAWDPVSKTKEGVKLGGANRIAVVRTNQAKKAFTDIYNDTAKSASIGSVLSSTQSLTTGSVTVSGTYTGGSDYTLKIVITSLGTQSESAATYNWCFASEGDNYRLIDDAVLPSTPIDLLGDGVEVAFSAGNYSYGDTFLIPVTAAISTSDLVYRIQHKDWGIDGNSIQHKIMDGTAAGSKRLIIYQSKKDIYENYDNLGSLFTVKYNGSEAYAAMSIISDGVGNAIKLQTYIGASASNAIVDIDIDLDPKVYKNIKSLMVYLSGFANYSVKLDTSYNAWLSVKDLDFMENADIKNSTIPVTAILRDMQERLKVQSGMCEIESINRNISNILNYDYTPLTGGSEGRSPVSWIDYFDSIAGFNITYIVPLTDDLSIMAECQEHVIHMSENMGKERRMLCGRGNHLEASEAIADAQRFASDRVQYVYPGIYDLNSDNEIELYPAYILAAQCAGRAAFLPDGESMTHDHFKMSAVERELEPDELKQLLQGGVVTFEFLIPDDAYSSSSVRMVWDLTTYTNDLDPLYVERAIGITADSLNKDIRNRLDAMLVGKRTSTAVLTSAQNAVISILSKRVKDEIIISFKDVTCYKSGGAVWVEYSVAPTEPTNFVLVRSHFYSEDILLTGQTTVSSNSISSKN